MVTAIGDSSTRQLRNLLRHCDDVRENCEIMGTNLIEKGEFALAKTLIKNSLIHDNSKFDGIEWENLCGCHDDSFEEAIRIHVTRNPHHPEYWGENGIHDMERVYVAEMVTDWGARSSEFGSSLRGWIEERALDKFEFSKHDRVYDDIEYFLNLLLEPSFEYGKSA